MMHTTKGFLTRIASRENSEGFVRGGVAIQIVGLCGALFHALFLVLFIAFAPHATLIVMQSVGLLLYAAALVINRSKTRHLPSAILMLQLCVYVPVWVVFIGLESSMQWFILCGIIPQFLFGGVHPTFRKLHLSLLVLSANLAVFLGLFFAPIIRVEHVEIFSILSLNGVILIILCELSMNHIEKNVMQINYEKSISIEKTKSMRDPLTGLWNRRYFLINENRLREIARFSPCSIAMLDIDHFKAVNDTYGHAVGDRLLTHFADLMIHNFRRGDIIWRWGGEEFMIFLSDTGQKTAVEVMTNFLALVRESPLIIDDVSIEFSFTAGVARANSRAPLQTSVEQADHLLYLGKSSGRSRIEGLENE